MEKKSIEKVKLAEGRLSTNHPLLYEAVNNIIRPSYVDISSLIEREDRHCNYTFYLEDKDGKLISFFMTSKEKLFEKTSFYLGLNATAEKYKNKGLNIYVILKALQFLNGIEKKTGEKHILYATTASPSIYHFFKKLNSWTYPTRDGNYTQGAKN
ncbi:hypothetical protein ACWGOQ_0010290 [Aquimarina sp. M1]